jgi:ketosteroid isomerase-like protein
MSVQLDSPVARLWTEAYLCEDIEKILRICDADVEWALMATGEVFKGFDAIRGLSARAISSREHTDELKMEARNAFVSADGTMMSEALDVSVGALGSF